MTTDPTTLSTQQLAQNYLPPDGAGLPALHTADTLLTNYVDGNAYFAALSADLDRCTTPDCCVYIAGWTLDPAVCLVPDAGSTPRLYERLLTMATAGLDVRVLIWGRFAVAGLPDGFGEGLLNLAALLAGGIRETIAANVQNIHALQTLPADDNTTPLAQRAVLDYSGSALGAWHQKAVVICVPGQSGTTDVIAYLGGIDPAISRDAKAQHVPGIANNLGPGTAISNRWHDNMLRLEGPGALDALKNFGQRWAEATSLPPKRFVIADVLSTDPINPPNLLPVPTGAGFTPTPAPAATDAIFRTIRSIGDTKNGDFDADDPGWAQPSFGSRYEIETSMEKAIGAAQKFIYVEDQWALTSSENAAKHLTHDLVFGYLKAAVDDRTSVVLIGSGATDDGSELNVTISDDLKEYIAGPTPIFAAYQAKTVVVHSKVVLIDDVCAITGSANFADRSLDGTDGEMSVSMVSAYSAATSGPTGTSGSDSVVVDLRRQLWACLLRTSPSDPNLASAATLLPHFLDGSITTMYPNTVLKPVSWS